MRPEQSHFPVREPMTPRQRSDPDPLTLLDLDL
jgi:hypothetical protein